MSATDTRDRLTEQLATPLAELGLDLEAVELSRAGKRRLVRVAVDKDGGVTMDDIAAATRAISAVLDTSDVMGEQPYTLEVSSPGVDRPLTLPRHWRRNRGRLVTVTFAGSGSDAEEPLTARLVGSDEESATLEVDGEERRVPYAAVKKARVQIEFGKEAR